MVAGGTGATVPITLWVVAEAAYEPQAPFSAFRIATSDLGLGLRVLVEQLRTLRDAKYTATQGYGWLTEVSIPLSVVTFESADPKPGPIQPEERIYAHGADAGAGPFAAQAAALAAASEDMNVLFRRHEHDRRTRDALHANLPRAVLATESLGGRGGGYVGRCYAQQAPTSTGCLPARRIYVLHGGSGTAGSGGSAVAPAVLPVAPLGVPLDRAGRSAPADEGTVLRTAEPRWRRRAETTRAAAP